MIKSLVFLIIHSSSDLLTYTERRAEEKMKNIYRKSNEYKTENNQTKLWWGDE